MSDITHWTMKDGQKIAIADMSDRHLVNTIRMVVRNAPYKKQYDVLGLATALMFSSHGEMAELSIEQGLMALEDMDVDDYLDEDPTYIALTEEAKRRGLQWEQEPEVIFKGEIDHE